MIKTENDHKEKNQSWSATIDEDSSSFIFGEDMIEKAMTADKPYYAIGVDTYDKDNLSYCLTRKIDGVIEVLLSKTMSEDERKFNQEVDNLAKYFDADVFKSGD